MRKEEEQEKQNPENKQSPETLPYSRVHQGIQGYSLTAADVSIEARRQGGSVNASVQGTLTIFI